MTVLCRHQHHVLYTISMANKTNISYYKKNIGEFCPEQQI